MSFIERNKAWILPLLGIAAIGVVYLNVRMLGGTATPAPMPATPPQAAESAPAPASPPTPAPAPTPQEPVPQVGAGDLWSDLLALQGASVPWGQHEVLLARAERPVNPSDLQPLNRSRTWDPARLYEPVRTVATTTTSPAPPEPEPEPPPQLAFVARTPRGPVAWMEGRPYSEGDLVPGGYRIAKIAVDRVVFTAAGRTVERFTHALGSREAN